MQIEVVTDIKGTPTLIDDIANALIILINNNRDGIYHVSGPQMLSRYEMAVNICNTFGFDATLVKPIISKELIQDAPRPKDTSLNTEKLKKEGILMHDTISGLNIMKGQMSSHGAI